MPTQPLPRHPSSRRYSSDRKAQAVRLVRQLRAELGTDHGTIRRVAGQLGYGVESVRSGVHQADVAECHKPGTTSAYAERIKALEQEDRALERSDETPAPGRAVSRPGGARPPTSPIVGFIAPQAGLSAHAVR